MKRRDFLKTLTVAAAAATPGAWLLRNYGTPGDTVRSTIIGPRERNEVRKLQEQWTDWNIGVWRVPREMFESIANGGPLPKEMLALPPAQS